MFRRKKEENYYFQSDKLIYNSLVEIITYKRKLFYEKYNEYPNVIVINGKQAAIFASIWLTSDISKIFGMKVIIDNDIKNSYDIKVMLEYERSNNNAMEIRSTEEMGK